MAHDHAASPATSAYIPLFHVCFPSQFPFPTEMYPERARGNKPSSRTSIPYLCCSTPRSPPVNYPRTALLSLPHAHENMPAQGLSQYDAPPAYSLPGTLPARALRPSLTSTLPRHLRSSPTPAEVPPLGPVRSATFPGPRLPPPYPSPPVEAARFPPASQHVPLDPHPFWQLREPAQGSSHKVGV